jgi:hypothetical protein
MQIPANLGQQDGTNVITKSTVVITIAGGCVTRASRTSNAEMPTELSSCVGSDALFVDLAR